MSEARKTGQPPDFGSGGGRSGGGGIGGAIGGILGNPEVREKLEKAGKRKLQGLLGKLLATIVDALDGDDDDDDDKPQPAPAPQPGSQPGTAPAPSPAPQPAPPSPEAEERRINGGHARLTGIRHKGPQGEEIKGERLREVRNGDNGPSDGWYAFDCTPTVDGQEFGPMPDSEAQRFPDAGGPRGYDRQTHPGVQGVRSWDGLTTKGDSGGHQVVRLTWDEELTAGSAELVHEGGNHGCTPRIKTVGARGRLTNLRFLAAGGVVIPVEPSTLNIGRQE